MKAVAFLACLLSVPTKGHEVKETMIKTNLRSSVLPISDKDAWENDSRVLQMQETDSRLIAYVPGWKPCPTAEQTAQYTHIMLSFAATYVYNEDANICDRTCTITPIVVCDNKAQPELVAAWKAAGKKVVVSFGGAGMGGTWEDPQRNKCWDDCFGKEDSVVSQLNNIVRDQGFDGVDIDYEYYTETTAQQDFLKKITTGLRASLPDGSIVSHTPRDGDLIPGKSYYEALKSVSSSLSFLNVQYYMGFANPIANGLSGTSTDFPQSTIAHYKGLVDNFFGGDPTKVVFGFCINGCPNFNSNGDQAADIMNKLKEAYSCNGGAFFWSSEYDTNTEWSTPVSAVTSATCTNQGPNIPTPPSDPTPPTAGTCGNAQRGDGNCPDPTLCCSEAGWCGIGEAYCGSAPPSDPTPTAGTCGNGARGDGNCPDPTLCCSEAGWCGIGEAYCGSAPPSDPTPTAGTCGNGARGDGNCPDSTLCCSQFGWCGSDAIFCEGRRSLRKRNNNSTGYVV